MSEIIFSHLVKIRKIKLGQYIRESCEISELQINPHFHFLFYCKISAAAIINVSFYLRLSKHLLINVIRRNDDGDHITNVITTIAIITSETSIIIIITTIIIAIIIIISIIIIILLQLSKHLLI